MDTPLRPAEERLLRETFLFRGADEEFVRAAAADALCTRESFPRGAEIYSPADFRRALGVILAGAVRVSKAAAGHDMRVSTLAAGEVFGAAALFCDAPRYVTTIRALRPCRVLFFPQALVERLLDGSPAVRRAYIAYLAGRVHFLNRKLEGLLAGGAEARLAKYLAERADAGGTAPLGRSVSALAETLHVGRASLYRAFETLEERGIAARRGREAVILDREGLRALADGR